MDDKPADVWHLNISAFAASSIRAQRHRHDAAVINGDQDVHVPITDTQVFEGRPDTDVLLIGGAGHGAFDKLDQLEAPVMQWLTSRLHAQLASATS